MEGFTELTDVEHVDGVLNQKIAVIYKHSTRCGLSTRTLQQMQVFTQSHPTIPVYIVDVIEHRPASDAVADRLHIRHESPQAILLRSGIPAWHGSHLDVTEEKLAKALDVP